MSNTTLTKSVFLAASRETVWDFLTKKDKLALWFHPAENDLKLGADYSLVQIADDGSLSKQCWGTVLEMDAPSHLKYSFTIKPLSGAMTDVTWTLESLPGGTKLSLSHEGISEAAGDAALGLLMALDNGWDCHIIEMRKALA